MLASAFIVAIALAGEASLASLALAWTAAYAFAGIISITVAVRGATGGQEGASSRGGRSSPSVSGASRIELPLETFRLDQAVVGLVISQAALGTLCRRGGLHESASLHRAELGMVAYPRVAAEADGLAARRSLWTFAALATAVSTAVAGVLALAAGWMVPLFFGSEFAGAVTPCRILLVASVFFSVRRVLSDGARGIGSPGPGTVAEVVTWIAWCRRC